MEAQRESIYLKVGENGKHFLEDETTITRPKNQQEHKQWHVGKINNVLYGEGTTT